MASSKTVRFLLPPKTYPASSPRRRAPQHCRCRFKCPTCEAVFSHYILLCVHTWSHAPDDLRVPDPAIKPCSILQSTENFGLQCFLCPLRFGSHLALRQHLDDSHTAADDVKLLRFACAFCAMRYASADLLIAHIQQHDVWEDGDFYPLFAGIVGKPLCERDDTVSSFELDDLIKELQKIAGDLPAQPALRKSAFSKKIRGSTHVPLNYLCALCGMKFQHGYQIDEHVRMRHKGFLKLMKARHACVYCGTKFFKLSVLREHLLMHHAVSVTPRKKAPVRL
ncbi:uncharacterized protein LOC144155148 [Haemaphysalis longicornis]|uniref:C2H2-type domain-containing protein n=1 Tax=Haemaphysalis longicornis TaxID=44386 RepID=A0A9J6FJH4_HAELO|nr:hypothetical protein HPB48_014991 [Haemaphysalis longicornis]